MRKEMSKKAHKTILNVNVFIGHKKGYPGPRGDKIACKRKLFLDLARWVTHLQV